MARRDRLKEALRRPPQPQPQRDPDAMDVDAAILGDGSCNGTGEGFGGISEAERRKRSCEGWCFGWGRQGHLKRDCPNRVKGKKKEENVQVASIELREEKESQEDATKEKRSDAPGLPPYDPANFIRHIRTLTMEERDEMLDKLMGIGEDFLFHIQSCGHAASGRS